MKAERLFRAIGLVDEGLIEAAAETPAKKRPVWRRYAAAAACSQVLAAVGGHCAVMEPAQAAAGSIMRTALRTLWRSCPTPGRCCP